MREAGHQPLPGGSLPARITELERKILIAFCTGALSRPAWEKLASTLADHAWHEPEHRVVFESICALFPHGPITAAKLLVHLNNRGFPDTGIEKYFSPAASQDTSENGAEKK